MTRKFVGAAIAAALVLTLGMSACATQQHPASSTPASSSTKVPLSTPSATSPSSTKAKPTPTPTPTQPKIILAQGSSSALVRELQARLRQVDLFPYYDLTDGFGPLTEESVAKFQEAQGIKAPQPGAVDEGTWTKLVSLTKAPSEAELKNMDPGPVYIGVGSPSVRELQHRLTQMGVYTGPIDGNLGPQTSAAVAAFQSDDGLYSNGIVDHRTWDHLVLQTRTPTESELDSGQVKPKATGLDPRCMTGYVVCVSMEEFKTRVVSNGVVILEMDARFGSSGADATHPGEFSILRKEERSWSKPYSVWMPWTLYFDYEGRAFHYSEAFRVNGYNGASHGCIQSRDIEAAKAFYNMVPIGTRVIIY